MSTSPLSSLRSPTPETIPVQPDHFYGQTSPASPNSDKGYLDPDDDLFATRGIPVFKPDIHEFNDFEGYINKIECWGTKSGIVKIVPPKEWTGALPSTVPQLANVKLRNPIEQQMVGRGGLFRQQNVEKRRIMSVREWAELCAKDELRAPTVAEAQGGRRHAAISTRNRPKRGRASGADEEPQTAGQDEQRPDESVDETKEGNDGDDVKVEDTSSPETKVDDDGDIPMEDTKLQDAVDPASSLPTPPPTTTSSEAPPSASTPLPSSTPSKRSATERKEAKDALDAAFLTTFDPHVDWLPRDMSAEDYSPEFCRTLERIYWRNCSLGKAPWYGADMQGSLFTDATQHWNVATLPSVLSRLLGEESRIAGVNTPYLYFGMWRATFAWHVEDMDLFSINYIHFGSPKHWYAVPQARSQALETTMKGYFPRDNTTCPQFLRHKSFLASPTLLQQSSVRPNTLVQHAGEFVVTFPRGYHAGFNLGFNCAESVNFALDSWLELGVKAAVCMCEPDSVRIDVKGLIEEKERREREGVPVPAKKEKKSPSKKRKAEMVVPGAEGSGTAKPKRPKTAKAMPASPDSIPAPSTKGKPKAPKIPKPKPVDLDPNFVFPCCLCASTEPEGLLRVHDPPLPFSGVARPKDGVWRAHEACASVVPETWVDEVAVEGGAGGMEKVVWGVDGIVRDRWTLKCAACTRPRSKVHGAPIQCTKGKCSKAFHVSCASGGGGGVAYRVVEEVEKEVVLLEPEVDVVAPAPVQGGAPGDMDVDQTQPSMDATAPQSSSAFPPPLEPPPFAPSSTPPNQPPIASSSAPVAPKKEGPRVIKTIKKLLVEVLCPQHNPLLIAQKKANKDQKVRTDLAALSEMSRIRIRNTSGVFEVSLVRVWEERGTVEVLWDGGHKREFRWGSIVWGADGQTTGSKPTAEELAKQPPPLPPRAPSTTAAAPVRPPAYIPPATSQKQPLPPPPPPPPPQQQPQPQPSHQYNPYSQPGQASYPPAPPGYAYQQAQPRAGSSRPPQYQGMSQFRAAPQPVQANAAPGQPRPVNPYEYVQPAHGNGAPSQFHGYYAHPYYPQLAHAQSALPQPIPAPAPYPAQPGAAARPYPNQAPAPYTNYYPHPPYLPLAPQPGPPKSASPAQSSTKVSTPVPPQHQPGATSSAPAMSSLGPPSS